MPAIFQPVSLFVVKAIFFSLPSNVYSNEPSFLEYTWFVQSPEPVVPGPYTDEATGDIVVTISKQLKDGSGVIALDLNLDEVLTASQRIKIGKEGFAFINIQMSLLFWNILGLSNRRNRLSPA